MTDRKLVMKTIYKIVFVDDKEVIVLENPLLRNNVWADCTRIRFGSVTVKLTSVSGKSSLYDTDIRYYTAERVLVNLDNVLYIEPMTKKIAEESE